MARLTKGTIGTPASSDGVKSPTARPSARWTSPGRKSLRTQ